jgi:hypothetical protein
MPTMTKDRKRGREGPGDEEPAKRPKRTGRPLSIWIPADLRDTIDEYIDAQRVAPDITAVVRLALEEFFAREGFPRRKPPAPEE